MKTLIELYGDRAIENVLAAETFRPDRVVYLCPEEIFEDKQAQENLNIYFRSRGLNVQTIFLETSMYDCGKILRQLKKIEAAYGDCAVDITGGTETALVAAGMFILENNVPAFTYSRKKNRFFDINNAAFADKKESGLRYDVSDFFLMTGGRMREGRVDNNILASYMDRIDAFFRIFLEYRRDWQEFIVYMQRVSGSAKGEIPKLEVTAPRTVKGEHGGRVTAKAELMHALEELGFLQSVKIAEDSCQFTFKDHWIRSWLRDAGSVLELYMYKVCMDTDIFNDVVSSAVVDWDGTVSHDSVSNEIDVVASMGVLPIFISCKTCEIKTEALNELAILADRFGGKGAKMAIVTTERCNAAARHRASQLGIAVIDIEELENDRALERILIIMKKKQ